MLPLGLKGDIVRIDVDLAQHVHPADRVGTARKHERHQFLRSIVLGAHRVGQRGRQGLQFGAGLGAEGDRARFEVDVAHARCPELGREGVAGRAAPGVSQGVGRS